MKRKRHTPEQVIRKLREAEAMLSAEKAIDRTHRSFAMTMPTCLPVSRPMMGTLPSLMARKRPSGEIAVAR